jgi:hypothetical protein
MAKTILALLNVAGTFFSLFAVDIVRMIYGWGVDPKSWPVIIACFAASGMVLLVSTAVSAALKE